MYAYSADMLCQRQGPLLEPTARQHVDVSGDSLTTAEEVLAAAGSHLAMKPTVFQGLLRHLAGLEAAGSLSGCVDTWVELLCEYGGFISLRQALPLSAYVREGVITGSHGLVMSLVLDNTAKYENDHITHGCYQSNVVERSWWPLLQRAVAAANPRIVASTAAAFYLQWLLTEEAAIRRSFVNSIDIPSYSGGSYQAMFNAVLAAARQHR